MSPTQSPWLRRAAGWLAALGRRRPAAPETFRPSEVRCLLRARGGTRAAAVRAAAADVATWTQLLTRSDLFQLGRTAERLPAVVYWYSSGVPAEEIGRRLSFFGASWDGEFALGVASRLIAESLNRGGGGGSARRSLTSSGRPRPQGGQG
jgi:hypothetical protein